jgi:Skp family chaperone for outer membrane proteins
VVEAIKEELKQCDWKTRALSVESDEIFNAIVEFLQQMRKAVKTLYESVNMEVWAFRIEDARELARGLQTQWRPHRQGQELDRRYIPTKYPNFHSEVPR